MSISMSKGKQMLLVFTLFLSNLVIMTDYIVSPTINTLYGMFPDSLGLVNFIVSGSYLIICIASPIGGKLCQKISTKFTFTVGTVVATAGGIFLIAFENPIWMCTMRGLIAVGYAFIQVSAVSLINQIWTDTNKNNAMMGYYNGAMTAIGALLSMVAGNLAVGNAMNAYKAFWSFVPLVILAFLFIPTIKNKAEGISGEENEEAASGEKTKIGKTFWIRMICLFAFNFVCAIPVMFISVYVAENGLGNESTVGYMNTVCTVTGFVIALLYGKIYEKLQRNILVASYSLMTLCMICFIVFPTTVGGYVAYFLQGVGYLIGYTYAFAMFPSLVPESRMSDGIAIITVAVSMASFLTSYVMTAVMNLMHLSYTKALVLPLIIMILLTVFEILKGRKMEA